MTKPEDKSAAEPRSWIAELFALLLVLGLAGGVLTGLYYATQHKQHKPQSPVVSAPADLADAPCFMIGTVAGDQDVYKCVFSEITCMLTINRDRFPSLDCVPIPAVSLPQEVQRG
jgi:hypothetical protein